MCKVNEGERIEVITEHVEQKIFTVTLLGNNRELQSRKHFFLWKPALPALSIPIVGHVVEWVRPLAVYRTSVEMFASGAGRAADIENGDIK